MKTPGHSTDYSRSKYFCTELPVADVNDCRVLKEQINQNNKDI